MWVTVFFFCSLVPWGQAIPDATKTERAENEFVARSVPGPIQDLDKITEVVLSPDGQWLATGSGEKQGMIQRWNLRTLREEKPRFTHDRAVQSIAISSQGRLLAGSSPFGRIGIWEWKSGKRLGVLDGPLSSVNALAFHPTNEKLLASGNDRDITLWDLNRFASKTILKGHSGNVYAVAFSPDGRFLVSGGKDRMIVVWDVKDGKEVARLRGHTDRVKALAFCLKSGLLASASEDGTVKLWDFAQKKEVRSLVAQREGVFSVAFSRDGKWLAAVGLDWDHGSGEVRVWEAATGKLLTRFSAHDPGAAASIGFTADDKFLITGGWDKIPQERRTVKLWKLERKSSRP